MVPIERFARITPMPGPDVYATAKQGWRTRLASPLAARARATRHESFFSLTGVRPGMRVVDVGCGPVGLRGFAPGLAITGVDVRDRPDYDGPFVQADASERLPFEDGEFDLAYSSSVIEHIPAARRAAFAAELRRVARGWYVQTPAFSFPVEPHALLPFAHWLPPRARRLYWRLGVAGDWEDIALLHRRELAALFPGAPVLAERVGGLAKSWISVAPAAGMP
jgi:SAM-dependent methyltransferase